MLTMKELAGLDGLAIAALIRSGEVKAEEVLELTIAQIDKLNPKINAVVTPLYEQARNQLETLRTQSTFAGVPYLLKDLGAAYSGSRMTSGCRLMSNNYSQGHSELVKRLLRSGLIILGKTNTPELGLSPTTEPKLFGATRSPWHPDHSVGGSSGGSAAAVASGMVAMAQGGDGGGSIRIPASCCGVFGLKPTRARTPLGPDTGDIMSGLVVTHALTRSVRDSAALLDITEGPDLGAPYWAPNHKSSFLQETITPPGKLRIGYSTLMPDMQSVAPDCEAAVLSTVSLCRDLGHDVFEATPEFNFHKFKQAFSIVWAAGCAARLHRYTQKAGIDVDTMQLEPLTRQLYETGCHHSAADYLVAVNTLQCCSRQLAEFFSQFDIWLTPTLSTPPCRTGSFNSSELSAAQTIDYAARYINYSPVFNVTGQPAMSVPLFWNTNNLPIGSHFSAPYGEDGLLFRLAGQLEKARPWADKTPPLFAG